MSLQDPVPKALFFDVFGTCVDWRSTVTRTLTSTAKEALASARVINDDVRQRAAQMTVQDWGAVAADWRATYYAFTKRLSSDPSAPYKTVDQHHHDSLRDLLLERKLLLADDSPGSLFDEAQISTLALVWHFLDPWSDTSRGLRLLNTKFSTATLSNGNVSLLTDMVKHADMPFTHIISSEMFKSYKPSPKVYLGAVERLGLQPEECVMVAAHLSDLKHAKSNGLRTVYVERSQEESNPELKDEGFVDVWVSMGEDGFVTAAEKLGVKINSSD